MVIVNTAELKNQANKLLNQLAEKGPVVITSHGHIKAALIPIADEQLEDLLWEFSPKVQKRLQKAQEELKIAKQTSLIEFAKEHGLT